MDSERLEPVRRVLERLRAAGIEAWLCGGWAEEIHGLSEPCAHLDIDLLYPSASLATLDTALLAGGFRTLRRKPDARVVLVDGTKVSLMLVRPQPDGSATSPREPGARLPPGFLTTAAGLPVAGLAYTVERQRHRQHDLAFLRQVLELLSENGLDVWVFGTWADRIHGIGTGTRNKRIELLLTDVSFARLEALGDERGWQRLPDGIHAGVREFVVDGTAVKAFLVRQDRRGLYTSLVWRRRFRWPSGTLSEVAGMPVASREALDRYLALKRRGRLRRRARLRVTRTRPTIRDPGNRRF